MALSAGWGSDQAGIMTKGMPMSRERVIAWAFVGAQFLLIGGLVAWHPRHRWSIPDALDTAAKVAAEVGLAWMAVGAASLGRSLTALPLPLEHATLRVGGLYRLSYSSRTPRFWPVGPLKRVRGGVGG